MNARERIERAFHVSFKLPGQAAELLDAYRDEVLRMACLRQRKEVADLEHGGTTGHSLWLILNEHIDCIDPDKES